MLSREIERDRVEPRLEALRRVEIELRAVKLEEGLLDEVVHFLAREEVAQQGGMTRTESGLGSSAGCAARESPHVVAARAKRAHPEVSAVPKIQGLYIVEPPFSF